LNRAALLLLRRGAGLEATANADGAIGNALDSFVGVWTEEDEREFLESIKALEDYAARQEASAGTRESDR